MEKKLYSLTNPQKSIYLTEEYSSNSNINNISGNIIIHEKVHFDCLEKALNLYVKKNDAIRIRIMIDHQIPKQYIHPYEPFSIEIVSLKSKEDLVDFNQSLVKKHFRLIDSNLFSFTLFQFPDLTGGLNVTFHHIIADAWTMSLFINEVMDLYSNLIKQKVIDESLNPSYIDYIATEKEYLDSKKFQKDQEFWEHFFSKTPELAKISYQPITTNFTAVRQVFHLDEKLYQQILDFCALNRCSTYAFFMSIFFIYLAKINNIESPIIGTPVLNRSNFKEKNTAGMYISTIPFKADVLPNLTFTDFLKNILELQMSIYRHQKYPYSLLLEELKKKYNYTQNLYNIVLSYQNAHDDRSNSDVNYSSEWLFNGTIADTLEIHFYDMDHTGKFDIYYDYKTSELTNQEIITIHERILAMIRQVINRPEILLQDIEIVTKEEKQKILCEFNHTNVSYDKKQNFIEIFEEYAKNQPNENALIFENSKITYHELNQKANQLAHFLREQSIPSNSKIAIYLPRCAELIIAMLAIKKSDCAYLLVENSLPKERIEYMLTNADVACVITTHMLDNMKFKHTIFIEDIPTLDAFSYNLCLPYKPENALSIVYTSGSTGTPKGILLKNSSLINLVLGYSYSMKADTFSHFLSSCSVSFDMFAAEVWIPLLLGKTLILANEEESKNPIFMSKLIEKEQVEFMLITSSKLNLLLLNSNTASCLKNVKAMQLGGEVLNPQFYNKLVQYTNAKIYNGYGPSETTSCATCKLVTSSDDITIGTPLPNVQVYICNQWNNLCPIHIVGELCISGDGVSYGYVNQPDLTSKNFVKNPFGDGLMYKTGDLAKFLPNGEIAYIGRNDSQIKIRGLRIELEEINKVIQHFTGIHECITLVKKVNQVDSICCYFVGNRIDLSALKHYASEKLPYYMVPSHFIQLEQFPLTLNGKIDTKKLPEIEVETTYVAPTTEMEEKLIKLWKSVLHLDKIGITNNFFDLGGDSLAAIRLTTELYYEFHVRVQMKDIFSYPSVQSLATYISSLHSEDNVEHIKKIKKQSSYIASSAQKRIYYTITKEGNSSITYNTPGGLLFNGYPNIEKLEKCFQTLIKRHESLRTYFVIEDQELKQKILEPFTYHLKLIHDSSAKIEDLFTDFIQPFNLASAPLFRSTLVLLKDGRSILLLDFHHIICDGESIGMFLHELCELYKGNTLPKLTIDYKDYTYWEQEKIGSPEYKDMENYWISKFQNEIPVLNMPTNFARPTSLTFEGNKLTSQIENVKSIYDLCHKFHITPYIFFLTAYYILLYKYTGQKDIVVGTPVAGRSHKELHQIIGMFVNSLALREKISSDETVLQLINRVMQNCFDAFKNEFYPFDELVKKLNLSVDTSRNPLFDTMFVFQNDGMKQIQLGDLKATYYLPLSTISKFDFTLEVLPDENQFTVHLEYNKNLYTQDFMESFLMHYFELIRNILKKPETTIAQISILDSQEKNDILHHFNSCQSDLLKNRQVVELWEEQVNNHASETAIIFEDKKFSYAEINQKANQIAHYLLQKNISKNSIIGILLPRSQDLITCMLGILKAGCAYMLIDSNLPDDRIKYMLENSSSPLLFTCKNVKNITFANQCYIDEEDFGKYSNQNHDITYHSEDLFSVIYTSGSTGTPKGVMLKRKGVMNLLRNHQLKMHTNECKNFISISTIAFDMFMVETFVPLLSGKTLILTNEEEQKIPMIMAKVIEKYHIDFILTTPSRIDLLCTNPITEKCLKNLKVIQLGGEVFTGELYERLSKLTNAYIYNAYGPTEITACCSCKEVVSSKDITIGFPFEYAPIYICDKDLSLCPIGVPGEICVAGEGVAKGYFNQPQLTQKSFIPNPFGNGTLYKTGDIGYYTSNGELHYIGREDFQIKIRGLRVELSEIEKRILEIPHITACSVLYKKESSSPYLVAFLTSDVPIENSMIREKLKKHLPLYMVPKYFVFLDSLPITLNGKIDKKQLDKLPITQIAPDNYIAPTTELERLLCKTWEQLLDCKVGIDDDVFELGADSLIAIKFKTELLSYQINIPYSDLFKYPTVRELCKSYESHSNTEDSITINYNAKDIMPILECNTVQNVKKADFKTQKQNNILLLGGNGFVGMHILYQFLKYDQGNIYCIIRNKNNQSGLERFMSALHFYFGNELDYLINKRIFIVPANITEKNFGLSADEFNYITSQVSIVIHAAAMVKHYGDKRKFKHVNVDLTKDIANYCKKYQKRLLYISSISVSGHTTIQSGYGGSSVPQTEVVFAENNLYIGQQLDNLYIKSKFEAEEYILSNMATGLEAQILRLGNITNRSSDGKFQINSDENAFLSRLKSFIKIGLVPENLLQTNLEFTPVDDCAKAIILIMQNYNKKLSVFHLYNDHFISMRKLVDFLNTNGFTLKRVTSDTFEQYIQTLLKDKSKKSDLSGIINDIDSSNQLSYKNLVNTSCEFTKFLLKLLGFTWPTINTDYLQKYLSNFTKED